MNITKAEADKMFKYGFFKKTAAYIFGYKGTDKKIELPSSIDGIPVTYIGVPDGWRHDSGLFNPLKKIIIPEGVKVIRTKAFCDCASLEEIIIADSVETIESAAFSACTNLKRVVLPKHLKILEEKTFYYCYNLNTIDLPDSIEKIQDMAFYGCKFKEITLPEQLIYIGSKVFSGCELETINLPKNVKDIYSQSFSECSELIKFSVSPDNPHYTSVCGVIYDKNVTRLIMYPCNKEYIGIPSSVTNIGFSAFYYCKGLKTVRIPDNIKNIEDYAFFKSSLTSVYIPDSVTSIGRGAFKSCEELKDACLPYNCNLAADAFDAGVNIEFR